MYTPKILSLSKRLALILGDVTILLFALAVSLAIRYQTVLVGGVFEQHALAFTPIFVVSLIAFFIAGLYDKDSFIYQGKIFSRLSSSYIAIIIFSLAIFYIFPYAGLTPKITLAWYVFVSYAFVFTWRMAIRSLFTFQTRYKTVLIGEGSAFDELAKYLQETKSHPFVLVSYLSPKEAEYEFGRGTFPKDITAIIFDFKDTALESLQEYIYQKGVEEGVFLIDAIKVYEDVFEKLYLPTLNYGWFFEHSLTRRLYTFFKRTFDVLVALPLGLFTLILSPFVALAIKLETNGPILIHQKRLGRFGKTVTMFKFRTMTFSDEGVWLKEKGNTNKVTKVGHFLRASRIDELPQLWNILKGELSLIGPRPDIFSLGEKLQTEIPYYQLRYIVTPGLSGWAQIMQEKPPQSVEETRLRLQYDLYYIKHRSLLLELSIALKTIKTLLMRTGM